MTGYSYRGNGELVDVNRQITAGRARSPTTLDDIRQRLALKAPVVSSTEIKEAIAILSDPRGARTARTAQDAAHAIRRYLQHWLGCTSSELDGILLASFVERHATEIETSDGAS